MNNICVNRTIRYTYYSWNIGCGCCSDSSSSYDIWEDGILKEEDVCCEWASDEKELRDILAHLEPFSVHQDSQWF